MIFNIIISFFVDLINFIIGLLPNPDPSVNTFLTTSIETFKGYIGGIDWIFPTTLFMWALGIVIVCEFIHMGWLLIKFVLSIVRGVKL